MRITADDATFFATADEFRDWLTANHEQRDSLWLGLYKQGASQTGITYDEAVEVALCFGWIDSQGQGLDEERTALRFSRRNAKSNWTPINIAKVEELTKRGLMHPAGLRIFAARAAKPPTAADDQLERLSDTAEAELRANKAAWSFFQAQAASYQRAASWWVMSAKQETMRQRRLAELITDSAAGRWIKPLRLSHQRS